jgi:hypothetical protein
MIAIPFAPLFFLLFFVFLFAHGEKVVYEIRGFREIYAASASRYVVE